MNKIKRIGILLIIIGMFIPIVLFPLTSYSEVAIQNMFYGKKVSKYSVKDLDFALVKGRLVEREKDSNKGYKYINRKAIPYKYLLVFGISLSFIGIAIVALHNNKKTLND